MFILCNFREFYSKNIHWHDEKNYNQLLNEENFEEIRINNNGKLLDGWIKYNVKQKPAPLLIFFGGNSQNSSNTCLNFLHNDKYKYFDGYNFMIIDYPGYGLSDGSPSDKTMFEASLKVYDYTSNLDYVDKNNIIILGYSIGTGIATYLASQRNVNGLILIAPYNVLNQDLMKLNVSLPKQTESKLLSVCLFFFFNIIFIYH